MIDAIFIEEIARQRIVNIICTLTPIRGRKHIKLASILFGLPLLSPFVLEDLNVLFNLAHHKVCFTLGPQNRQHAFSVC